MKAYNPGSGVENSKLRARTVSRRSGGVSAILNFPHPTPCRMGLTIYEVVLSLAIFVMAMVAISQLISTGSRASSEAQLHSQAAIRAENKMAEIVAGFQPLSAVTGEVDPNDARWLWSMDVVDSANASGVKELTVTVTHLSEAGEADVSYTLKRLMRDPQLYIDAALAEEEAAAEAEAKASSANASGSSTGRGTGTAGTASKSTGSQAPSSKTSGGSTPSSGSSGSAPKSGGGAPTGGSSGQSSSKAKS